MLGRTNLRKCVIDMLAFRSNNITFRQLRAKWNQETLVEASPYADAIEKHLDEITSERPLYDI